MLPISESNWSQLVERNSLLSAQGLVEKGVFATGIGPQYSSGGLLYVGKSAGPLGTLVGSEFDQAKSSAASTAWMVGRRNLSAFWQMVDLIDATRRTIAWTNIAKMDVKGGGKPPGENIFSSISESSLAAFEEEIEVLKPGVILFATSGYCSQWILPLMQRIGFTISEKLDDGHTTLMSKPGCMTAILTRHPQGWQREPRDRVAAIARSILGIPSRSTCT